MRGYELHTMRGHASGRGWFYRAVQAGNTVHLWWGRQGRPGHYEVRMFPLSRQARQYLEERVQSKKRQPGYYQAYCTGDAQCGQSDVDSPEVAFLADWSAHVVPTDGPDGVRVSWAAFSGLLAEDGLDHGVAAVLGYLRAAPHFVDAGRDIVIGQVGAVLPPWSDLTSRTRWSRRLLLRRLGPIAHPSEQGTTGSQECPTCAERMPALLHFQIADRDPFRTDAALLGQMCAASRRLAHVRPAA